MDSLHVLYAFALSVMLSSFTDWYFFGVLFHDRYSKTPGVWKTYQSKKDEMRSVGISQAIMSVSLLVFILVCGYLGLVSLKPALIGAGVMWVMIPVPLLVTNAIFIPMDRLIVVSHSLGWLVRFVITAICVSWFL